MCSMRKSRLSNYKQSRLMEHFVAGTTARVAGSLVGVNKSTAAYYFHRLREIIAGEVSRDENACRVIGIDEAFFGEDSKFEGCRGQDQKIPVFGLFEEDGELKVGIFPALLDNISQESLGENLEKNLKKNSGRDHADIPDATIYMIGQNYPRIFDVKAMYEHRTIYPRDKGGRHYKIATLESFWAFTKRHLNRFNGVKADHLYVFLKECEWRYNNPEPIKQLKLLKNMAKNII